MVGAETQAHLIRAVLYVANTVLVSKLASVARLHCRWASPQTVWQRAAMQARCPRSPTSHPSRLLRYEASAHFALARDPECIEHRCFRRIESVQYCRMTTKYPELCGCHLGCRSRSRLMEYTRTFCRRWAVQLHCSQRCPPAAATAPDERSVRQACCGMPGEEGALAWCPGLAGHPTGRCG